MNWMKVKELAEYLKLSEMMIYKLAQSGEIPASKIGSTWRFSQAEIDRWLLKKGKNGPWLIEPARSAVEGIVQDLKEEFGDNLSTVVIFGSHATGEAGKDSDLDILIVLKSIDDYWMVHKRVGDIAYDESFGKDRSVVIAPILMNEEEYLVGNSPLLLNIRKEGRKAA